VIITGEICLLNDELLLVFKLYELVNHPLMKLAREGLEVPDHA
jgi:hypothetical protein